MKNVVIWGAGGFGQEVLPFLQTVGHYKVVGFIDTNPSLKGKFINGIPVLGDDSILESLVKEDVLCVFIAVGNSSIREPLFKKILDMGLELINIIHPSSVIVPNVSLGRGVVIYPNATINTNVRIGDSVLINSNVSIGHDVEIGDFVNVNPGVNVAGRVKIKKHAFLGIGCSVLENVVIGQKAIIGGGALVRKDVLPETVVVGVPARSIRSVLKKSGE